MRRRSTPQMQTTALRAKKIRVFCQTLTIEVAQCTQNRFLYEVLTCRAVAGKCHAKPMQIGKIGVVNTTIDPTVDLLNTMNPLSLVFKIFRIVAPTLIQIQSLNPDPPAIVVGGLGIVPGANMGETHAVFEAVHGSAPDIAGQGKANPTALMLSSALMLIHLGELSAAARLRGGIERVYAKQEHLPPDVGGSASTNEFTDAVIANLG